MLKSIKKFKLTLPIILIAMFSVAFFAFAETTPPSFEICNAGNCEPTVANSRIVDHEEGIIPGNDTYRRGSRVRIHADITDPAGIKSAKAIIKDATNVEVVRVPLYNDGNVNHADDSTLPLGSAGAETDDTYSNFWTIPYRLQTGVIYSLYIEATDNFGHTYYPPASERDFSLTDTCLSTCPAVDSLRCNGKKIEICVFDNINQCNAWETNDNCLGDCCPVGGIPTCCGAGLSCSTVNTCITCDNTCNGGICSNPLCATAQDPDCNNPNGCCGDGCCDNGIADMGETCVDNTIDSGENPGTCSQDCPDLVGPAITFISGANSAGVGELIESFQLRVKITDDYNQIVSSPSLIIKDSGGSQVAGPIPLTNMSGDIYEATIKPENLSIGVGNNYTIDVTATDTFAQSNSTTEVDIHSFDVYCMDECSSGFADCDDDGNDGNDKNNVTLLTCSPMGDGCNDITTWSCGPFPPTTLPWQVCRIGSSMLGACCTQDCDPDNYTPTCADPTHIAVCSLDTVSGCYNEISNQDCTQGGSFPNRRCALNSLNVANCCEDKCANGTKQCNGNVLETCNKQANGCYDWDTTDNCADNGQVCKDSLSNGTPITANCCSNSGCSALGTDVDCGGSGGNWIMDCVENTTTGCFSLSQTATDCSASSAECHVDSSSSKAGCCTNECNPGEKDCFGATKLSVCNSIAEADGCFDATISDCTTVIGDSSAVCKDPDADDSNHNDNCCVDECVIGDPLSCDSGFTMTQKCALDSTTGCKHWVQDTDCSLSGEVCYPGTAGADAHCAVSDSTAPTITLSFPLPSVKTWIEDTQTEFELGGTNDKTSTGNTPGNVELAYSSTAGTFTKTDSWTDTTGIGSFYAFYYDSMLDVSGASVKIKQMTGGIPGYYSSGEYIGYIDGGSGPGSYEWDKFSWNVTFPALFNTSIEVKVKSHPTTGGIDFSSGYCTTGAAPVTVNGDLNLDATCINASDRYLFYYIKLNSD